MKLLAILLALTCTASLAQDPQTWIANLAQSKDYVQKRVSSYDTTGANADYKQFNGGETITLLDVHGPGVITHIWFTIASVDPQHLKALVLRAYWDGESTPSVETPVGDFFGLGLGEYYRYQSIPLSVGSDKALNSYFPMPFQKHARITVTNDGAEKVEAFYFNIDYRAYAKPLSADQLYFHAERDRQRRPGRGAQGVPRFLHDKSRQGRRQQVGRHDSGLWGARGAARLVADRADERLGRSLLGGGDVSTIEWIVAADRAAEEMRPENGAS